MYVHAKHTYMYIFLASGIVCFIAFGGWRVGMDMIFALTGDRYLRGYGDASSRHTYNTLLITRGASGDTSTLSRTPIVGYESETYELIGDALYTQSGAVTRIRDAYEQSLRYRDSSRVRAKLGLLSSSSASSDMSATGSRSASGVSQNVSSTGAANDITAAHNRITEDSMSRGEYMGRPLPSDVISDAIEWLDTGTDRPDW